MAIDEDLDILADALNRIATLYQFRSLDTRLYGMLTVSQSYCLRVLYFQGVRTMSELASELLYGVLVRLDGMCDLVLDDGVEKVGALEDGARPCCGLGRVYEGGRRLGPLRHA